MDPNEKFMTACITRKGMAEDLNEVIQEHELDIPEFEPGDDRLTQEVMEFFVAKVEKYDELLEDPGCTHDAADEWYAEGLFEGLELMGYET